MDVQSHHSFLLQQKLTLLVNRYQYFLYNNAVKGEEIAFAEQDRFAFREAVTVWTNEHKGTVLFTIKAEKLLDVHGKFLISDANGALIGYCKKVFGASLLRSTWELYDAHGALICIAHESSHAMAIARRVAQFIPVISEISPFFPFNFAFEKDGIQVGTHHRVWGTLTDQYAIELGDGLKNIDRRIVLACGILLDALQDR